jgi:glyoxylase-like metal-dependent hydrolase (beta-lactamase superfamily II)
MKARHEESNDDPSLLRPEDLDGDLSRVGPVHAAGRHHRSRARLRLQVGPHEQHLGRPGAGVRGGSLAPCRKLYNLERGFLPDGSQFDHLFKDGETFRIGEVEATAMLVPGHTPADMAYLIDGSVFVGDTLFMPDVGSARADFPGGDAHELYRSMHRLLALPPETTMYVCHDYPPAAREPRWKTTVAEQRAHNIHVHDGIGEDEFVAMREARDATLEVPTLILPSIQVNVRAGQLPPPDENGVSYLRIPLNALAVRPPSPAST